MMEKNEKSADNSSSESESKSSKSSRQYDINSDSFDPLDNDSPSKSPE